MSRILFMIRDSEGLLSRADLGRLTKLNKSTVSSLVDELIDRGIVIEVGANSTNYGRPSTLLNLNPDLGQVIGIEMGVNNIKVVLANVAGEIIWRTSREINRLDEKNNIVIQLLELVECAMATHAAQSNKLLGLGITLPGLVNFEEGLLVFAPNLSWHDTPFKSILEAKTGLPVQVENDAHAAALGEHFFGKATSSDHFIFIVLDAGVGSGLYFDGDIFRGAQGFAGQLGHSLFINEQHQLGRCGNVGCFETTCNMFSVVDMMRARLQIDRKSLVTQIMAETQSPLTFEIISSAAQKGDHEAVEVLKILGQKIGLGLVNLINLFNPELFVIGGAMNVAGDIFIPEIKKVIKKHQLSEAQILPEIVVSDFGSDASVMGAVALVIKNVLDNPRSIEPTSPLQHQSVSNL